MSFANDMQALRDRAATRVANVANSANRLMQTQRISQLAALAVSRSPAAVRKRSNPLLTREQADGCHAPSWDDAKIQAFTDRRDRLLRWGYSEQDADDLAERLTLRDREQDDRVSCTDCRHYRPGRCGNQARAELHGPEVGRDLAAMLQRCPGFQPFRGTLIEQGKSR